MEKLRDILQIIFFVIWIPLGLIIAFMLLTNSLRVMGPAGNPQAGGFVPQGGQQQFQQQGGYNQQQQGGGSTQGGQMMQGGSSN